LPKKIDAKVKERCTRQVHDHLDEYSSLTAARQAVARRERMAYEPVRRWVRKARPTAVADHRGAGRDMELKAKVSRLEEDNEILRRPLFAGELCATRRRACREVVRDHIRRVVAAA